MDGKTRRERFTAEFEVGLRLARLRIIDIFTATRYDLFSKKERATKKQIKMAATSATALDQDDPGTVARAKRHRTTTPKSNVARRG